MALITPYSPSDSGLTTDTVRVDWLLSGHKSGPTLQSASHTIGDCGSSAWSTSMIECRHPEGKLWRSMFIPTTVAGAKGLSITWWGKDDQVKGQTQVKIVSESEWYTTVKSKAVAKGYGVETYIGRRIPLQVGHNFVKDLAENDSIPQLPQLSFSQDQANSIAAAGGPERIGMVMAKALSNILPTNNFFRNINGKGHSLNALLSEAYSLSDTTAAKDVVQGLMIELTGVIKSVEASTKPPEPQIDREEVYGSGWGAFG